MNVSLTLSARIGRAPMRVREILGLGNGSVVPLDRRSDEPIELFANEKLIAYGEIVAVDGRFGVRITELAR
jgi:flagellar motor switch protein FliN/FliY